MPNGTYERNDKLRYPPFKTLWHVAVEDWPAAQVLATLTLTGIKRSVPIVSRNVTHPTVSHLVHSLET